MEYKVIREFGLQQKQEVAAIFVQQSHAQGFVEGRNQKKVNQDKYKVLARVPLCVQLVEVFEVTPNNIMIAQARQHRATNEQSHI